MTTTETNAILLQVGEEIIELTGQAKEKFEAERKVIQDSIIALIAESEAKNSARTSALAKLAALGLTEEEIAAL
jgi:uncharacterized protein YecA (UPF0149 family)